MSKIKDELIERGECRACRGAGRLWDDAGAVVRCAACGGVGLGRGSDEIA